ncbi:MAG: hypothetical protein GWN18_17335, partial [Thermoplasmata archaeon]|nr:hypothetical protein [Thermoplasmata archaeon]NIS13881.1 hypothetical protein [Thermoplasmata archaeon]NIS21722.1 hypothetical protein [Thermoplasmata archaeon]NIT79316.1 hypothetical protein [Thermoplasmata archaeon]NIU50755.1 hypothetical protein [Thermoplasmata archaeon]
ALSVAADFAPKTAGMMSSLGLGVLQGVGMGVSIALGIFKIGAGLVMGAVMQA